MPATTKQPSRRGARWIEQILPGFDEVGALVARFNLRRVYYWLLLASLVGLVGGIGALVFKWLADHVLAVFWPTIVSFAPPSAGGEPVSIVTSGPIRVWGLIVAPAVGGLLSGLIVYRFAPEAAGHGTDAAIRAYHREGGRIRWQTPLVKLVASSLTLGSGGSAGREGPIAQIGAGFGSLLGTVLRLSERERGILLMAGVSAGIGAIFRAPFAGAIFAAEVLYREPDIEPEVLVPALLSSIVSYSVYCAVHGFGHLFTGTEAFAFVDPVALLCYGALGLVVAFGGIAYVTLLDRTTAMFRRWRITNYAKPAIGGTLVGIIAAAAYLVARDTSVLAVMGSGYGTLQRAVSESSSVGPSLAILGFVAIGKMLTTSLTIGSGGSGGVFGPSMVIGGCLGAAVGTLFHAWLPGLVPDVGPFTIVGMAGFFAGVAKTPISTLLMVGELTGNYALLLPSMLVVCLSMIIVHRWTIYNEQVRTRAESPVHRGELLHDVLAELAVEAVLDGDARLHTVTPSTPIRDVVQILDETHQRTLPVVDRDGQLHGVLAADVVRAVLAEDPARGLVVAEDLLTPDIPMLRVDDSVQRALELFALQHVEVLPVVSREGGLVGLLDRRAILGAYRRRIDELRGRSTTQH
jgi:CIC family chloride channel protein